MVTLILILDNSAARGVCWVVPWDRPDRLDKLGLPGRGQLQHHKAGHAENTQLMYPSELTCAPHLVNVGMQHSTKMLSVFRHVRGMERQSSSRAVGAVE